MYPTTGQRAFARTQKSTGKIGVTLARVMEHSRARIRFGLVRRPDGREQTFGGGSGWGHAAPTRPNVPACHSLYAGQSDIGGTERGPATSAGPA